MPRVSHLRHSSLSFALDEALSSVERELLTAARREADGERTRLSEPRRPNPVEAHYLNAIFAFRAGRMTHGFDELDRGDRRALLRLGRSNRSRRLVRR
jgi:hypothetical protein